MNVGPQIDLVRGKERPTLEEEWITATTTRRGLGSIPHGALIRDALDFRPRTDLPTAVARSVAAAPPAPPASNRSTP